MFRARGKRVVSLHRVKFAGLTLPEELKPGEYRVLSNAEWGEVRAAAGLSSQPEL
jgi:16S rRNA U516 pseudouridylate synthase RsuA-like enzyme